jgi:general secretion pathway protein G
MQEIMTKLEAYRVDAGTYPTEQQGLKALVERPTMAPEPKRWRQHFRKLPLDPWGNDFVYHNPGKIDRTTFEILSKGADPEKDDDDISSQNLD